MTAFTRLAALPKAPVLWRQGTRLRRDTPRLPDARLPWTGSRPGPDPVRLIVLGDSTAAGVGAETQDEALPGWLAVEFDRRFGRGTDYAAFGRNGATARDVLASFVADATAAPFDVALLTIGANDALGLRSRSAFARDVAAIVTRLQTSSPGGTVLVSLLPRFDRFELLPEPLRTTLGAHAMSLDSAARTAIESLDGVIAIPPPPPYVDGFFATDQFHPSTGGYRMWAEYVLDFAESVGFTLERGGAS